MIDQFIKLTETQCSLGFTSGFSIFSIEIRWYAISYILGLILGQLYIKKIIKFQSFKDIITNIHIDDFLIWAMLGIIIGGRLGYVAFYNFSFYINSPINILYVWQGGMSFHGGLIGISISMLLFALKNNLKFLNLADLICAAAPIGIFLGRISNFLNGELWGKESILPWAIVFKCAGTTSRHPSQLYEALLEGIILFAILYYCIFKLKLLKSSGKISGLFCILYACSRIMIEIFREPDRHIGLIYSYFTMGMFLSIPIFLIGVFLYLYKK